MSKMESSVELSPESVTPSKSDNYLSIGIDVSSQKLDICLHHPSSESKYLVVSNDQTGIDELISLLVSENVSSSTPIILEATGSYHWLCSLILKENGFNVKIINPIITKKYQRASIRGAKTDKVDSFRLAEIGIIEQDLPDFFDSRKDLSQKQYQSILNKLQTTKQQLQTSLGQIVKTSESIGISLELDCVEKALEQIEIAIKTLKKLITKHATDFAKELSDKIKGLSLFQATVITVATEQREFSNRDKLTAFFGIDVKQRQSGNWSGKQSLSKRGNPYYRKILFQLGWSLQRHNQEYRDYYDKQKIDKDKHYYTAIIATTRKFLRFYYKCMKTWQETGSLNSLPS